MSIRELIDKCKSDRFVQFLFIVLVGVGSFGLGRLSVLSVKTGSVYIESSATPSTDVQYVIASKTGKKYYLPWCGSVHSISDENKLQFNSAIEAERAGYEKALNCKGL